MDLPRYKSHKEVRALKIAAIEFNLDGSARFVPEDKLVRLDSKEGVLTTKPGFYKRWGGSDDDLGYYVLYGDGYESWSPTKAFEEGYTKIE